MSDKLHNAVPDSKTEIERLAARRDELLRLQEMMTAKLKACPNDYGVRAWWGFVIIGLLVGWIRSSHVWSILLYGLAFWSAGMFFCVFALESVEVQSRIAIFLRKLGEDRISTWLYHRALTIR